MALVSFPTIIGKFIGRFSHSLSFKSQATFTISEHPPYSFNRNSHNKACVLRCDNSSFSDYQHSMPNNSVAFSPRRTGLLPVPFNASKNLEPRGEDSGRALEAVLRLYTAIKNKNIPELSDLIGDECLCFCNFFSYFQPFRGKKEVLDFFLYLIRSLGNRIEFVVTPTMHDGMNVGIKWRLECKKTHVPLGKGFSFHICHVYHGKVVIRNVEMFLEPLLHIEPFRLIIMGYVTAAMEKISSKLIFRNKPKRAIQTSLAFFIIVALLLLVKSSLN